MNKKEMFIESENVIRGMSYDKEKEIIENEETYSILTMIYEKTYTPEKYKDWHKDNKYYLVLEGHFDTVVSPEDCSDYYMQHEVMKTTPCEYNGNYNKALKSALEELKDICIKNEIENIELIIKELNFLEYTEKLNNENALNDNEETENVDNIYKYLDDSLKDLSTEDIIPIGMFKE